MYQIMISIGKKIQTNKWRQSQWQLTFINDIYIRMNKMAI